MQGDSYEFFGDAPHSRVKQGLPADRNRLTGEIPPELGELSKLEVLDVAYNDLEGTIPAEIMRLTVINGVCDWDTTD